MFSDLACLRAQTHALFLFCRLTCVPRLYLSETLSETRKYWFWCCLPIPVLHFWHSAKALRQMVPQQKTFGDRIPIDSIPAFPCLCFPGAVQKKCFPSIRTSAKIMFPKHPAMQHLKNWLHSHNPCWPPSENTAEVLQWEIPKKKHFVWDISSPERNELKKWKWCEQNGTKAATRPFSSKTIKNPEQLVFFGWFGSSDMKHHQGTCGFCARFAVLFLIVLGSKHLKTQWANIKLHFSRFAEIQFISQSCLRPTIITFG